MRIVTVLEGRDEIQAPRTPYTVFSSCRIEITKYLPPHGIRDLYARILEKRIRVVPQDLIPALRRLSLGDYKQFIDSFIDIHVCPYICELCRESGPRILHALADLGNVIELYSECVDVCLLIELILGDLVEFVCRGYGYRDGRRFSFAMVPKELLDKRVLSELEKYRPPSLDIEASKLSQVLKYLEDNARNISELLVAVPCITEGFLETVLPHIAALAERGIRVLLLTRPPTEAEVLCPIKSLSRYLMLYLELVSRASRVMRVCCSNIVESAIVINREAVVNGYEPWLDEGSGIAVVKDRVYAQNIVSSYYRQCICSSPLVREDK